MDRWAWWATVHGVSNSQTRLNMYVPQFISPSYCHCTVWGYYEKSCFKHSFGGHFWQVHISMSAIAESKCSQIFSFSRLFPKVVALILFLLQLVFEHVTKELLHWSIPYGLAEKEELNTFRSDKPQRREKQEQFPKPGQERGHHQCDHQLQSLSPWYSTIPGEAEGMERRNERCPG